MLTDEPTQQGDVVVKAEGGTAGRPFAKASDLPPLPLCQEHPRRELELYCKLCKTVMCMTCRETEHSRCQKKWDKKRADDGLIQSIVFEGVEKVALGLKEEVLNGLGADIGAKEIALQEAASGVAKRKREVETQLAKRKKEVDAAEQAVMDAMTQRFNALRAELEKAAAEKAAALEEQEKGLGQGATSLKGARVGAEETLEPLVVEERPIEVVSACLKLKQELAATLSQANQTSAPVCEADLYTTFTSLDEVVAEINRVGWCGTFDIDVTKCTLSKADDERILGHGCNFDIILTTRDKMGQQLKIGGLEVTASVEPKEEVEGEVAVENMGDGTYAISFTSKDVQGHVQGHVRTEFLALAIEACGSPIPGSPFSVALSPSSIVTTVKDSEALSSFVPPGKTLELCYRASRDGWSVADFHRLCDGKGPTLVVAKEETKGYIFGGYTTMAWSSPATSMDVEHVKDEEHEEEHEEKEEEDAEAEAEEEEEQEEEITRETEHEEEEKKRKEEEKKEKEKEDDKDDKDDDNAGGGEDDESDDQPGLDDDEAFLFSVRNPFSVGPIRMPRNPSSKFYAIYRIAELGPAFGSEDLTLLVEGVPQSGESSLGVSYTLPKGHRKRPMLLAGHRNFRLSEMEVFLVK